MAKGGSLEHYGGTAEVRGIGPDPRPSKSGNFGVWIAGGGEIALGRGNLAGLCLEKPALSPPQAFCKHSCQSQLASPAGKVGQEGPGLGLHQSRRSQQA